MTRSLACLMAAAMLGILLPTAQAQTATSKATNHAFGNAFYVLENGVVNDKHPTPDSQAMMVKELGYDGIGYSGLDNLPERLAALDRHGLKLFTLYIQAYLDTNKPKYDPRLPQAIKQLANRDTMIWLTIQSGKHKSSDPAGDARAVEIVRELADIAKGSRVRIALYPHTWWWVERVEDAVRVAQKVNRPNVGVTFNLCHWLKVDKPEMLEKRLELAKSFLFQITINGADTQGDWDKLIQTLDRGNYDPLIVLKALRKINYQGPVGLQCYNVAGDKQENLKRSITAWRKLNERLNRTEAAE